MSDKYVLLVEDNPDDVLLTRAAFKKCGISADLAVAGDGEEALDFLFSRGEYAGRGCNRNPAAILLDLKLPCVSGLEVLRQIRADERTRKIPVIVLSSSVNQDDIKKSYESGADDYYRKPVSFDHFKELIQQISSYWQDRSSCPVTGKKDKENSFDRSWYR